MANAQLHDQNVKKKKDKSKGSISFGIAVCILVFAFEILVDNFFANFNIIMWVAIIGFLVDLGLIIYFFISRKKYTGIGLTIALVIGTFVCLFFFYAWAMAGFPSLK